MNKSSKLIAAGFLAISNFLFIANSQTNVVPIPGPGNVGLGVVTGSSNFNLQVHGASTYTEYDKTGVAANFGYTSRIGLTNSTTGSTANDGLVMRMSQNDFILTNKENGALNFLTGNLFFGLSGSLGRACMGTGLITGSDFGIMNYYTSDNGIFIRTTLAGKYGISIRSHSLTDVAIQVMGNDGTTRNFAVQANGNVFARRYTTTLANIPDYVFSTNYNLMTFTELRTYIALNSHLPNVPSAQECQENGVDLGEMNRILLEKVEELTLYILQLEERMKSLEENKK